PSHISTARYPATTSDEEETTRTAHCVGAHKKTGRGTDEERIEILGNVPNVLEKPINVIGERSFQEVEVVSTEEQEEAIVLKKQEGVLDNLEDHINLEDAGAVVAVG
ncbi:unnamed protein product, partial [Amoebophrya sp. A25]